MNCMIPIRMRSVLRMRRWVQGIDLARPRRYACATIMGSEPISNTSPLLERTDGTVTTTLEYQYGTPVWSRWIFGLSNLTVIRDTVNNDEVNGKERIDRYEDSNG